MIYIVILADKYIDMDKMYLKNSSTYQVRALYVPLFCRFMANITRPLDLTHTGLGFVDEQTGEEFTLELESTNVN
jgi:hypothetical protein